MTDRLPAAPYWEECYVAVQSDTGPETIRGLRHRNVPGLAITGHRVGYFAVTHVPSGRVASRTQWERCVSAMHALLDMAPLCDWTQDGGAVKAEIERRCASDEMVKRCGDTKVVRYDTALARALGSDLWGSEFPWEDETTDPWVALEKRDQYNATDGQNVA